MVCLLPQGTPPPTYTHSSRRGPQHTQHTASTAATPRYPRWSACRPGLGWRVNSARPHADKHAYARTRKHAQGEPEVNPNRHMHTHIHTNTHTYTLKWYTHTRTHARTRAHTQTQARTHAHTHGFISGEYAFCCSSIRFAGVFDDPLATLPTNPDLDQSGVSEKLRVNSEPKVNLTLTLNLRNPQRGKGSQNKISEIPSVDSTAHRLRFLGV